MTSGRRRPNTGRMAERILMIDDDDRLAGMVSDYLGGAGFRLTLAATAREGETLLKRESFDAVILDLMLPDSDGLDLCRRLRATSDVPILMLTARGEPMDRVVGLEIGADDRSGEDRGDPLGADEGGGCQLQALHQGPDRCR